MQKCYNAMLGISFLLLTACTSTSPLKQVDKELETVNYTGHTPIIPSTSPRIGRLYFSGEGRRPSFVTTSGKVYNELCYDDFSMTGKLSNIDKFIIDDGVVRSKTTISGDLSGSISGSIPKTIKALGSVAVGLNGSSNRTYIIEKLHRLSLTDEGKKTIKDSIGAGCEAEISKLKKNRHVVLIVGAQRAEKSTDTRVIESSGSLGSATTVKGALTGKSTRRVVDEYDLVYISIQEGAL